MFFYAFWNLTPFQLKLHSTVFHAFKIYKITTYLLFRSSQIVLINWCKINSMSSHVLFFFKYYLEIWVLSSAASHRLQLSVFLYIFIYKSYKKNANKPHWKGNDLLSVDRYMYKPSMFTVGIVWSSFCWLISAKFKWKISNKNQWEVINNTLLLDFSLMIVEIRSCLYLPRSQKILKYFFFCFTLKQTISTFINFFCNLIRQTKQGSLMV